MMNEPEGEPAKEEVAGSEEAVAKTAEPAVMSRFDKLVERVDALAEEAVATDDEIHASSQRIRAGQKAYALVDTVRPAEEPHAENEAAEVESEAAKGDAEKPREEGPGPESEAASEEPASGSPAVETRAEDEKGRQWYYGAGRERRGPVTEGELRLLLKTDRLPAATPVWTMGQKEWISAAEADLVSVEEESPPPLPEPVLVTEAEKDCPECGVANRVGAKFCRGCGHSLAAAEVVSKVLGEACPSCEAPVAPEAKFCRSCGTRLK